MVKIVELPDGREAEFPDTMDNAAIAAVLAKQFPKPAPPPPPKSMLSTLHGAATELYGGAVEPVLKLATSALAKPAGDVAGLVSGAADVISGNKLGGRNAQEVQQDVQRSMTYEPRTVLGKSRYNPLNAIPEAIGTGVNAIGEAGANFVGQQLPGEQSDPFSPAGIATNALREAIPQVVGVGGAKYLPKAVQSAGQRMQGGAVNIMRSALNPPGPVVTSGAANAAARTLLRENIPISGRGIESLQQRLNAANEVTDAAIIAGSKGTMGGPGVRSAPAPTISAAEAAQPLEQFSKQLSQQVDPMADVAAVSQLNDRFLQHESINNKGRIPLPVANAMQRGTEAKLTGGGGNPVSVEGQRLLAESLRKGIQEKLPSVEQFFTREADLTNALSSVERKAFKDMAADPLQLALYIKSPVARATYLANKSTRFKATVAKYLNKAGQAVETAGGFADEFFSGAQ